MSVRLKLVKPKKDIKLVKVEMKEKKPKRNLGSDEYQKEFEEIYIDIDSSSKVVLSVKRGGEFGLPRLDMRIFQTTELFTGNTKEGFKVPIEVINQLIPALESVRKKCEEKDLFE